MACKKIDCSQYFNIDDLNKIDKIEGDNICFMAGLFKTNKNHEISKEKIEDFLIFVSKIIKSDFFEGCLCEPFQYSLVNIGTYKFTVDDEGKLISLSDNYERNFICDEKNILFRDVILFYFKSNKSKEEINKLFNKEICFNEGEFPKNEW